MRYVLFFSFLLVVCFSQQASAHCEPLRQVNIIQFLFENDVIFVGEMINMPAGSSIYKLKILTPLKGVPEGVSELYVKQIEYTSNDIDKISMDATHKEFLIFAHYGENSELIATNYSCKDIPSAQFIIYFLKGPYKYRYLILILVAFVIFSIWRVGAPINFITADLKSLPGAIFLNKPIKINDNPSYFSKVLKKVLKWVGLHILIVGFFVLLILIKS